jgi:1-acyl-sn-glycerol-3-phosphate acyltransferase
MKVNKTTVSSATENLENSKSEDEPLIPANKDRFWAKILDLWIYWLVEHNFSSIRIKNKENYNLANPNYAKLLYAPHCCFHDGQVAYYICKNVFNANFYMMIQDLYKLPILSKIGGFSVEKDSPIAALKSINYASNLLADKETMLWIFPQGRVMPPDYRPIKFESGLTYISNKVAGINLIPISIKYAFVRDHKPDIFADIGEPIIIENGVSNKKEFTKFLEEDLTNLSDAQTEKISQGDLDEYEVIYKNKEPLFRRLEPYLKNIVFDKRYLKRLKD